MNSRQARTLYLMLLTVVPSLGSSCAPIGTFQSATTVKPGFTQVQVRPEVFTQVMDDKSAVAFGTEAEVRYGVHELVDIGLRGGSSGLVGDVKQRLVASPQFNVAVAPSYGVMFYKMPDGIHNVTTLEGTCPLIFGYQPRYGGPEFVVAPKMLIRRLAIRQFETLDDGTVQGETEKLFAVAGALSAGIRIPIPMGFELFPEITVGYPMFTDETAEWVDPRDYGLGGLMFTAGVGIGFGRRGGKYYNNGDSLPF